MRSLVNPMFLRCLLAVTSWIPLLTMGMGSASEAAVTITIQHVSVLAGETAQVGVFASSNSNDIISGFNLPMDINNDGMAALPMGFTLGTPTLSNALYPNTMFDMPPSIVPANVDAIPTGTGNDVTLELTTKLFDLFVDVATDVPVGTVVPLQILIPADPLQSLFNIAGPGNPQVSMPSIGMPTMGSIRVVPEPASFFPWLMSVLLSFRFLARR